MKKQKDNRNERTLKQGLAGGILGAFVGAPGLGMVLGVANANKDKIKQFSRNVDNGIKPKKSVCKVCNSNPCKCVKKSAIDNPADFF